VRVQAGRDAGELRDAEALLGALAEQDDASADAGPELARINPPLQ
jgi:hypothetical protein